MQRTLITVVIIFVILGMSVAFTPSAEEEFTNLKILPKTITEEALDSVMEHFSVSLGVKCGFCHAMDADTSKGRHLNFASDDKEEKEIARYMMRMTTSLNNEFFNPYKSDHQDTLHTIMCYTCHRGSPHAGFETLMPKVDSLIDIRHLKH